MSYYSIYDLTPMVHNSRNLYTNNTHKGSFLPYVALVACNLLWATD